MGSLAGSETPYVIALAGSLAGKFVCGHQCGTGFASRSSTRFIPRGRMGWWFEFRLGEEVT